jgi:hypothetical protein
MSLGHFAAKNRKIIFFVSALILWALFPPGLATAQNSWWERGKELLQGAPAKTPESKPMDLKTVGAGLKEALRVGTERVVGQLGRTDGFYADPTVHIPLPASLHTVQTTLNRVGMGSMLDDLELRLNRAAEAATPRAKELFWKAIREMTLEDVQTIYRGPDDAATRYFQKKMSPSLAAAMGPVVEDSLAQVGAIRAYDRVMGRYRSLPWVPDAKADLKTYVVDKSMAGIFHYLALEEAAIRKDPARRTTGLLKKVFGAR